MSSKNESTASLLRLVNREIWIVTSMAGDERGGLVATWVSASSIDDGRPVMLAGIAPNHFTRDLIDRSGVFALHLLTSEQVEVVWNFAFDSGRHRDKLANVAVTQSDLGNPLLNECLAWFDCRVFARCEAGDRVFYWADVEASKQISEGKPLCEQELFFAADEDQLSQLKADRDADVVLQRPWHDNWRNNLSAQSTQIHRTR